jgi:hypothetical protein
MPPGGLTPGKEKKMLFVYDKSGKYISAAQKSGRFTTFIKKHKNAQKYWAGVALEREANRHSPPQYKGKGVE